MSSSLFEKFSCFWTERWCGDLQVVLAPHLYCPEVSGAKECFAGQTLYDSLDKSYGYLTVAPGWCKGTNCHVSPSPSVQPAFCQHGLSSSAQLSHNHRQLCAWTALGWLVFMQRSTAGGLGVLYFISVTLSFQCRCSLPFWMSLVQF